MTKKIFRSIVLVALAVLVCCMVIIMGVLYEYFTAVQRDQLSMQVELAARGVESEGMAYLDTLAVDGCRLTWVAADGAVRFDSEADAASMENHAQREEIAEALITGRGESERASATLAKKTLYLARRLADGTVLRVSTTQYTVWMLVVGMLRPLLIVLFIALILSGVLAKRLSQRVVEPLNALDLDHPLDNNNAYEELAPLLTRIARQHRQIVAQVDELRRRQDEFATVTSSMNEGLVLLNRAGRVLSINPAARRLFHADADCEGKDFLTVDRNREIGGSIFNAMENGHAEMRLVRDGGEYQLDLSRIGLKGADADGVVLLSFDVTQKAQAERQRQEFTANVSHELKTPLQAIMGSAELIENGLVKPEDMPRFVGHIRQEAARLVTLIEDIIRLSQLDEKMELPREDADLYALALEAAQTLASAAQARKVRVEVRGGPTPLRGVRRLLYEIVYNLCDNAIKYNQEGGEVTVTVAEAAGQATLTVADTGIGIPPEQQDRVFERFYRVDKSHSRETGGTGLGLSIVKHAAQIHGARVTLESEPGKGTTVTVRFPQVA